jgi:hypothetical protein
MAFVAIGCSSIVGASDSKLILNVLSLPFDELCLMTLAMLHLLSKYATIIGTMPHDHCDVSVRAVVQLECKQTSQCDTGLQQIVQPCCRLKMGRILEYKRESCIPFVVFC